MQSLQISIKKFWQQTRLLMHSVPAFLMALLVAAVIAMNLLANKSIVNLDWLALDCGIFFSWAIFLVMDIVTRRFGVRAANTLSVIALLINLVVAFLFWIVSIIPGVWSQSFEPDGAQAVINGALDATFASSWIVILGSSVAFLASCIVNNLLHHWIAKAFKKHNFWAFSVSSYVSTFIAQFLDNLLFAVIISAYFFDWNVTQIFMCALTGAVCELLCEVVFSPFGYRIAKRLEQEGVGNAYLEAIAPKEESV